MPLDIRERIENDFVYHTPHRDQLAKYGTLRIQAKELALSFARLCPVSKELDQALFLLNLAVMSANAAIARNE